MKYLPTTCLLSLGVSLGFAAETPLDGSNSWPMALPEDPFTADAWLDLRTLNERRSGETGFVGLSADGNGFVRGDGEPIRFWAVGTDGYGFERAEDMDVHCRWLAKLGVNLAWLHVAVVRKDGGIRDLDEGVISGCHRFIKVAKDNGIYVIISPLTIESGNDYATVNVVSLDGLPLGTSGRVLVQVVTVNRLTGWLTKDATFSVDKGEAAYSVGGEEIVRIGEPPFRIAYTEVRVTLKNPRLGAATQLDINGYPMRTWEVESSGVDLPEDAIYVVLHAGEVE